MSLPWICCQVYFVAFSLQHCRTMHQPTTQTNTTLHKPTTQTNNPKLPKSKQQFEFFSSWVISDNLVICDSELGSSSAKLEGRIICIPKISFYHLFSRQILHFCPFFDFQKDFWNSFSLQNLFLLCFMFEYWIFLAQNRIQKFGHVLGVLICQSPWNMITSAVLIYSQPFSC